MERGAMDRFWAEVDVLVLPSLTTRKWAEQFGRVLVEAMARGVVPVGSSSGAIPEVIGDAGLVFEEGDAMALSGALQRLASDADLRGRLAAKGIERVRRLYAQDVVSAKTVAFYDRVLRG
jgi:glycosyltransferase involved in cell wall biosynthesis